MLALSVGKCPIVGFLAPIEISWTFDILLRHLASVTTLLHFSVHHPRIECHLEAIIKSKFCGQGYGSKYV